MSDSTHGTIVAAMEVAFGGDTNDTVKLCVRTTGNEGQFELFVDGGYLASGAPHFYGTFAQCMDQLRSNAIEAHRGH